MLRYFPKNPTRYPTGFFWVFLTAASEAANVGSGESFVSSMCMHWRAEGGLLIVSAPPIARVGLKT